MHGYHGIRKAKAYDMQNAKNWKYNNCDHSNWSPKDKCSTCGLRRNWQDNWSSPPGFEHLGPASATFISLQPCIELKAEIWQLETAISCLTAESLNEQKAMLQAQVDVKKQILIDQRQARRRLNRNREAQVRADAALSFSEAALSVSAPSDASQARSTSLSHPQVHTGGDAAAAEVLDFDAESRVSLDEVVSFMK